MPNFSAGDVVSRTIFRKSMLYGSFVDFRTRQVIQKAKTSSGKTRLAELVKASSLPSLSQEVRDTVVVASTLFDEAVPLMQRVQLLASNPQARTVALDWDPANIVGVAADWFLETPLFQHMHSFHFLKLAPVFIDPVENLSVKVSFPILKQSLILYRQLNENSKGEAWAERLMSAALSARLGIADTLEDQGDFVAETAVPTQVASTVWKATSTYMSFVKRGMPVWFEVWQSKRNSQKYEAKI